MNVSVTSRVPVAFGVLTVRDAAHAVSRSIPGPENKGGEAARAALMAATVIRALRAR
jgi:6,7-dimethyl-8-ribityllumazine synthase